MQLANKNIAFRSFFTSKLFYYLLAFLIRIIVSIVFADAADCYAFIETARNVIKFGRPLYYQPTEYSPFAYSPLAYLTILPGMAIYYLVGFENPVLEQLFLKIVIISADLWLAALFSSKSIKLLNVETGDTKQLSNNITYGELFILFNPILIYSSAEKSQFFNICAIMIIYSWRAYQKENYLISGLFASASFLLKENCIIFAIFLGWIILLESIPNLIKYAIGFLIIAIPVFLVGALINLNGMLNVMVLYHLHRDPSGYSLTSVICSIIKYISIKYNIAYLLIVRDVINYISKAVLIGIFVYLAIRISKLQKSPGEYSYQIKLLHYIILAIIWLFILYQQFFFHYLPILIALWLEYKSLKNEPISNIFVNWNYALIPVLLVLRVTVVVPPYIQQLLGSHWVVIMWFIFMAIHFLIVGIMLLKHYTLFTKRLHYILYGIFILSLIITIIGYVFIA